MHSGQGPVRRPFSTVCPTTPAGCRSHWSAPAFLSRRRSPSAQAAVHPTGPRARFAPCRFRSLPTGTIRPSSSDRAWIAVVTHIPSVIVNVLPCFGFPVSCGRKASVPLTVQFAIVGTTLAITAAVWDGARHRDGGRCARLPLLRPGLATVPPGPLRWSLCCLLRLPWRRPVSLQSLAAPRLDAGALGLRTACRTHLVLLALPAPYTRPHRTASTPGLDYRPRCHLFAGSARLCPPSA